MYSCLMTILRQRGKQSFCHEGKIGGTLRPCGCYLRVKRLKQLYVFIWFFQHLMYSCIVGTAYLQDKCRVPTKSESQIYNFKFLQTVYVYISTMYTHRCKYPNSIVYSTIQSILYILMHHRSFQIWWFLVKPVPKILWILLRPATHYCGRIDAILILLILIILLLILRKDLRGISRAWEGYREPERGPRSGLRHAFGIACMIHTVSVQRPHRHLRTSW